MKSKIYQRYQRPDSQEMKHDGINAVVYAGPGLVATGYRGKADKPAFNFRFQNQEQMNAHIANFFSDVKANQDRKEKIRAEKKEYKTDLVIGDILYSSWGYDQTNIDFYQVISVTASRKSIFIRPIASERTPTGDMQGNAMPVPDEFTGPELKKKVSPGGGRHREYVNLNSFASAWKWDGNPKSYTSYA